ncbi:MAG: hypothetical protein BWK76_28485 [Desulfobulbaceae bacterium A2]|nr:MAG: hypothetical protein BWK76_28485 [Desulfobulbaceae bacterium A2]
MDDKISNAKVEYEVPQDTDGIGEGKSSVPGGWKLYVFATIAWMVYYIYAYTPIFSGWTQTQGLK